MSEIIMCILGGLETPANDYAAIDALRAEYRRLAAGMTRKELSWAYDSAQARLAEEDAYYATR